MKTVGFIGLGLLGHALASRLVAAGHEVAGYDVLPERRAALAALGGKAATSVADAAAGAEAICVALPTLQSVEEVILGGNGLAAHAAPGATVIQMSTISPTLTERLAQGVAARGLSFLDCPVSGTSAMVARGDGIIIGGGDVAAFERARPILEAMLPRAIHVGSVGHATLLKLVANLLVGVHSLAAAEALAMARRGGLDLDRALGVLTAGAATSRMLEVRGPMIACDEYPAQMKLDLFMKDLHLIQDAARALGTPIPLTDVAERFYDAAHRAGHAAEDLAVVATVLSQLPSSLGQSGE